MLRWITSSLAGVIILVVALKGQNPVGRAGTIDLTVSEGTSMALALSPDRQTMAIDLQGGLWTVPIKGGAAKRIIDEYDDARQPSWSPDGRSIAFQAYRDGTWRIWTVGAGRHGCGGDHLRTVRRSRAALVAGWHAHRVLVRSQRQLRHLGARRERPAGDAGDEASCERLHAHMVARWQRDRVRVESHAVARRLRDDSGRSGAAPRRSRGRPSARRRGRRTAKTSSTA